MLPILIIVILLLIAGVVFIAASRAKYTAIDKKTQAASKEYFLFLNSIILGLGSDESAKEFCKVMQIWDGASTPEECLSAMHFLAAAASIVLSEARSQLDTTAFDELCRSHRYHKNHLLWALHRNIMAKRDRILNVDFRKAPDRKSFSDDFIRYKKNLAVRYFHLLKPYVKPWDMR